MNKLEALRALAHEYWSDAPYRSGLDPETAEAARALFSDPANAVVLVPRKRDKDGKPTCKGCDAMMRQLSGGYCCLCHGPTDGYDKPLPDCQVWRGAR